MRVIEISVVVQDVAIEQWTRNYVRILTSRTGSLANCPSLSTRSTKRNNEKKIKVGKRILIIPKFDHELPNMGLIGIYLIKQISIMNEMGDE